MSNSTAQVIVDDSDPSIVYHGQGAWAARTGVDDVLYGTLHEVLAEGSLSYIFNGTSVSALFFLEDPGTISSCTVDGEKQIVAETVYGQVHNLMISIKNPSSTNKTVVLPIPLSFDHLIYTASGKEQLEKADTIYYPPSAVNITSATTKGLSVPGDKIDFTFNGRPAGTSLAFHGDYSLRDDALSTSLPNASLSYRVDDGPLINFTLSNIMINDLTSNVPKSIVQTPLYGEGDHTFHLEFLGPIGDELLITVREIIVQNAPSTQKLGLQIFPAVPNSSSATLAANNLSHHRKRIPEIVVPIVAVLVTIFISALLFLKWRATKRNASARNTENGHLDVIAHPFIPAIFTRTMVLPSKAMLDSVVQCPYIAGKRPVLPDRESEPTFAPTSARLLAPDTTPSPAATIPTVEQPIYMIHTDGGSIHEASSTMPGQGEPRQVIDLPPVYSAAFIRHQQS
ncbi:hypothetical protein CPC08DRAFT_770388 [Agrocybe pediades]|nr:hypothetical protein CPC08DRAFT_770388 [Agrocybe pediades]